MTQWVALRDLLSSSERVVEAAPDRMSVGHGGVWWGVTPCQAGMEKDEDGNLVCRREPEDVVPQSVATQRLDVSAEEPV